MVSDRDIPQGILNDVAEIPENGEGKHMIFPDIFGSNPRNRGRRIRDRARSRVVKSPARGKEKL